MAGHGHATIVVDRQFTTPSTTHAPPYPSPFSSMEDLIPIPEKNDSPDFQIYYKLLPHSSCHHATMQNDSLPASMLRVG